MTAPDWKRLALAGKRCSAVYLPDGDAAAAAFAALGSTVLGRYCDDRHQAIAHVAPDGTPTLSISGTRVSEGTMADHVGDLLEDVDCAPLDLGDGICVAAGAHQGLDNVWAWALPFFGAASSIDVEGHSLGGWRTCYTPLFLPEARIGRLFALEPPKPANAAYWAKYAGPLRQLVTIVHGRDPWFAWPWISRGLAHPPGQSLIWLHDGTWSLVSEEEWPGGKLGRAGDHGPDTAVVALEALAAAYSVT